MSTAADMTGARESARSLMLAALAAIVVLIAGAFGLFRLWPLLDAEWSNIYGAFSHGYLVVLLCLWLGVRYWRESPPTRIAPTWLALLPLTGLVLGVIGMEALFLNTGRLVLLPLLLLATIATTFGWNAARTVFWPTMFLYLALPQWWVINGALQSLTTAVASALVKLTDLPAFVEGNFIHVPAGVFEIASGCSGLSYFIASLSLAGFYALMYLKRWRNRLWLLAAAGAMAMLSNFLRVYVLIVIGIATDMQHYLIKVDHLYFGWVLFGVAMVPVFWLAYRLDQGEVSSEAAPVEGRAAPSRPSVAPSVLLASVATAVVLLLPRLASVTDTDAAVAMTELPDALGPWRQDGGAQSAWQPVSVNAQEQRAAYASEGQRVEVYRAVYPHQTSERRLIRAENYLTGHGWREAEERVVDVDAGVRVTENRGYLNEQPRLIWSWYVVAGMPATSKLEAKLREIAGLLERRRDAMAVAISTECVPDCETARARLAEFTRESAASLQQP